MTPDEERRRSAERETDEALTHKLAELGPLMRRQEWAEAQEPDQIFAQALRARLMSADTAAASAHDVPAHDAPAHDAPAHATPVPAVPRQGPLPAARRRYPSSRPWAALAAAALVAVAAIAIAVIVVQPQRRVSPRAVAFAVPYPGLADLTRSYPVPAGGGGGGVVTPTVSLADTMPGAPYGGRLHLAAATLPASPVTAQAYRLAAPTLNARRVAALAARLGIRAPVTRAYDGGAAWLIAAIGILPSPRPLHSIAVSTLTGEVIYHDLTRQQPGPIAGPPLAIARAVAIARAWLTRLGRPAARMPLQAVHPVLGSPIWAVDLGWPGAGPATSSAATVWVSPRGTVTEARLWPLIAAACAVGVRSLGAAWADVRSGRAPIAVADRVAASSAQGRGRLQHVDVAYVLAQDRRGGFYLVPVYRFAGMAQFDAAQGKGAGVVSVTAPWYALVPATGT